MPTAVDTAPGIEEKKGELQKPRRTPGFAFPFRVFGPFPTEFDRLFESVWSGRFPGLFAGRPLPRPWTPDIEVLEKNGQFLIRADLPGLKKEQVTVEVLSDAVVIEGERKEEFEETKKGYYRTERSYGSFSRTVPIPEGIDPGTAHGTFKDGVLEISLTLPKTVAEKPKRLQIEG
jgi:HSP20 family protein